MLNWNYESNILMQPPCSTLTFRLKQHPKHYQINQTQWPLLVHYNSELFRLTYQHIHIAATYYVWALHNNLHNYYLRPSLIRLQSHLTGRILKKSFSSFWISISEYLATSFLVTGRFKFSNGWRILSNLLESKYCSELYKPADLDFEKLLKLR